MGSSLSTREAAKIASASFATTTSSSSSGKTCADPVGMFGNLPHQRQRRRGGRYQQVLSCFELQPHLGGQFGETVQFYRIDRCRDAALVDGHGRRPAV